MSDTHPASAIEAIRAALRKCPKLDEAYLSAHCRFVRFKMVHKVRVDSKGVKHFVFDTTLASAKECWAAAAECAEKIGDGVEWDVMLTRCTSPSWLTVRLDATEGR